MRFFPKSRQAIKAYKKIRKNFAIIIASAELLVENDDYSLSKKNELLQDIYKAGSKILGLANRIFLKGEKD